MPIQVIGEAGVDIRALSTKFQQDIQNMLKGVGTAGNKASQITPQINQDALKSQLNQSTSTIDQWVGGVKQTVNNGLATLGAAAGGFLATSLFKGFQRITVIQDATASLTVALGSASAAAGVLADVLKVVTGTPFNLDQFANAASQMISFGVEAQKIPIYLTAIGEAAATRGSQANEYAQRLSIVFGQVSAIGRITTDSLYSLNNVGVNALQILGNSFNKTTAEIREMVSKGLIPAKEGLDILAKGITDGSDGINGKTLALAGTMAKLRETLTGAIGGFSAATARFGAALIKPLTDGLTALFTAGSTTLDALSSRFKATIQGLVDSPAAQSFIQWIRDIPTNIGPAIDKLLEFKGVVLPLVAAIGSLSLNSLSGVLGPLGAFLPKISPLLAVFATIVASSPELQASFLDLGKSLAELAPVLTELTKSGIALALTLTKALVPAVQAFVAVVKPIISFLASNAGVVKTFALALGAFLIVTKITTALNSFKAGLSGATTGVTATGAAAQGTQARMTSLGGTVSRLRNSYDLLTGAIKRKAQAEAADAALAARGAAPGSQIASVAAAQANAADAAAATTAARRRALAGVGAAAAATGLGILASQTDGAVSRVASIGSAAAAGFAVGGPWGAAIGGGFALLTGFLDDAAARTQHLKDVASSAAESYKTLLAAELASATYGQDGGQADKTRLDFLKAQNTEAQKSLDLVTKSKALSTGNRSLFDAGGLEKVRADAQALFPNINLPDIIPDGDLNFQYERYRDVIRAEGIETARELVRSLSVDGKTLGEIKDIDTASFDELEAALGAQIGVIGAQIKEASAAYTAANKIAVSNITAAKDSFFAALAMTDDQKKQLAEYAKANGGSGTGFQFPAPTDAQLANFQAYQKLVGAGVIKVSATTQDATTGRYDVPTSSVDTESILANANAATEAGKALNDVIFETTGLRIELNTTAAELSAALGQISGAATEAAGNPSWGVLKLQIAGVISATDELKKAQATDPLFIITQARTDALQQQLSIQEKIAKAALIKPTDQAAFYSSGFDVKKSIEEGVFTETANQAAQGKDPVEAQNIAIEKAKELTRQYREQALATGVNTAALDKFLAQIGLTPDKIVIDLQLNGVNAAIDKLKAVQTGLINATGDANKDGQTNVKDLSRGDLVKYQQAQNQIDDLKLSVIELENSFDDVVDNGLVKFTGSSAWAQLASQFDKFAVYADNVTRLKAKLAASPVTAALQAGAARQQGELDVAGQLNTLKATPKTDYGTLISGAQNYKKTIEGLIFTNIEAGESIGNSIKIAENQAQQFIDTAVAAGFNKDEVNKLAQALGLLPGQVAIDIKITGVQNALQQILVLKNTIANLAKGQDENKDFGGGFGSFKDLQALADDSQAYNEAQLATLTAAALGQIGASVDAKFNPKSGGGGAKDKKDTAADKAAKAAADLAGKIQSATEDLRTAIIDLSKTIQDYATKLAGDIRERTKFDRALTVTRLIGNVTRRTKEINQFSEGLTTLRGRGLSESAVTALNLTGPEALKQIKKLLNATPDQINQLNTALTTQKQDALNVAAREEGKVIAEAITVALEKFFASTAVQNADGTTPVTPQDPTLIGQLTLQVQNQIADPQALALAIANAVASKLKR